MKGRRGGGLAALALLVAGCVAAESTGPRNLRVPDRATFPAVADALQPTCGTLDCHGQPGRNLRLYGAHGLRLAVDASPAEGVTTPDEYQASFWSVVGLEPEALNLVLRDQGRDPERLSLFRKARGRERHAGGTLSRPGDALDRCLLGWLTARADAAACSAVSEAPRPGASP